MKRATSFTTKFTLLSVWATTLLSLFMFPSQAASAGTATLTLPNNAWTQIVSPATRLPSTIGTLFGSQLSENQWAAFAFEPDIGYVPLELDDLLSVGDAFWMIQITGADINSTIDVDGSFSNSSAQLNCPFESVCTNIEFEQLDNQVTWRKAGSPYPTAMNVSDMRVVIDEEGSGCENGCSMSESSTLGYSDSGVFVYNGAGGYNKLNEGDTIEPLQGFWFAFDTSSLSVTPRLAIPIQELAVPTGNNLIDTNGASEFLGVFDLNGESFISVNARKDNLGLPSAVTSATITGPDQSLDDAYNIIFDEADARKLTLSHPSYGMFWATPVQGAGMDIAFRDPVSGELFSAILDTDELSSNAALTPSDSKYAPNLRLESTASAKLGSTGLRMTTSSTSTLELQCPDESLGLVDASMISATQRTRSIANDKPEIIRDLPLTRIGKGRYSFVLSTGDLPAPLPDTKSRADEVLEAACVLNQIVLLDKARTSKSLFRSVGDPRRKLANKVFLNRLLRGVESFCKAQEFVENSEKLERSLYEQHTTIEGWAIRAGGDAAFGSWDLAPNATTIGTKRMTLGEGSCPLVQLPDITVSRSMPVGVGSNSFSFLGARSQLVTDARAALISVIGAGDYPDSEFEFKVDDYIPYYNFTIESALGPCLEDCDGSYSFGVYVYTNPIERDFPVFEQSGGYYAESQTTERIDIDLNGFSFFYPNASYQGASSVFFPDVNLSIDVERSGSILKRVDILNGSSSVDMVFFARTSNDWALPLNRVDMR